MGFLVVVRNRGLGDGRIHCSHETCDLSILDAGMAMWGILCRLTPLTLVSIAALRGWYVAELEACRIFVIFCHQVMIDVGPVLNAQWKICENPSR